VKTWNQRGQGMTEYIILVALIAVAAIAAVRYFGARTKEGFETAAEAVGGVNQSMGGGSVGDQAKQAGVDLAKQQVGKALTR
jgi:pilus assembly protein Flp/PilA